MSLSKLAATAAVGLAALVSLAGESRTAVIFSNSSFQIYDSGWPTDPTEADINLDNGSDLLTTQGTVDATTLEVTFSSPNLFSSASGVATIKPKSGSTLDLTMTAPTGYDFTDFIFSFMGIQNGKDATDKKPAEPPSDLTVSVFNGLTNLGSFLITPLGTSNADFAVFALGLTTFTSIELSSTTLKELKQFSISGLEQIQNEVPPPVPLPPAIFLFAGGLGLLGWLRRSKRQAAPLP